MRIALDTNRYRDLADGVPAVVEVLERATSVHVPFVVVAELRAGFSLGSRGKVNEVALRRFLDKPGVEVMWPSDATPRAYAALYRQLRTQGTPIPTSDLWIAALVVEHDPCLYSRDEQFAHLAQLDVLR